MHPIVEHSQDGDAAVLLAGAIAAAAGALFGKKPFVRERNKNVGRDDSKVVAVLEDVSGEHFCPSEWHRQPIAM